MREVRIQKTFSLSFCSSRGKFGFGYFFFAKEKKHSTLSTAKNTPSIAVGSLCANASLKKPLKRQNVLLKV